MVEGGKRQWCGVTQRLDVKRRSRVNVTGPGALRSTGEHQGALRSTEEHQGALRSTDEHLRALRELISTKKH